MIDKELQEIMANAVSAKVALMVEEALGDPGDLMTQFVAAALQQKVKVDYREMPLMEKLARDTVTKAAQEAMVAWLENHGGSIRSEIERQLTTQKKEIASSLVQALVKQTASAYGFRLTFTVPEPS